MIDLTHTLTPEFPTIVMPPELGQCAPFRMEEVSRYDERGPAWYWNNFSMGEHTGTHFDAPIHWVTGKDLPDNAVDTIPPAHFLAPACVIDCSAESAADADFVLTIPFVEAWEAQARPHPAAILGAAAHRLVQAAAAITPTCWTTARIRRARRRTW